MTEDLNQNEKALQVKADISLQLNEAEEYILDVFYEETTQERIKDIMQNVIRQELEGMKDILREGIRAWINSEKANHHNNKNEEEEQKKVLLLEQVDDFKRSNKRLETENMLIARKLELQAHETKIILAGMKKFSKGTNK